MGCPWCHGGLQAVVLGIQDPVSTQWCPACSFIQEPGALVRPTVATGGPNHNILLSVDSLVAYGDTRGQRQWQWFEDLMSQGFQGDLIREVYGLARRQPGPWIATATMIDLGQWFRAMMGLSWYPAEPQVAVRCRVDSHAVELAFATEVIRRAELQPTLYEFLTPAWRSE
jgi:hypothetical protein